MFKGKFKDIVLSKDGFLRGPFGSALKKSLLIPKSEDAYKVYEQGVILEQNKNVGKYYISKEYFLDTMKRFEVKPKDFIVSCSGVNYGSIYQLPEEIEKGIINQALLRIRLNNKIIDDNYFLYYFKTYIAKVITIGTGDSTIPNFPSMNFIKDIDIELPNLEKQKKVGNLLKSLDNKIELNNKINIELEAMAKTIYDYWFLQFEFPNEEGKPYKSSGGKMVWNEELKREIPEGWEVKKLKELFQFIKGKTAKSLVHNQINKDFKPYITIDVANGEIPKYCNDENMIICNGETIMVMDGAASGDIYVGIRGILGSTFAMLLPIDNSISSILIYHILQKYKDIYKKVNTGSTVPHANKDFIGNINVALPKDLSFFNSTFTSISKKIILNKKENRELTSLRDFLLPLLMNGQVGFKDKEDKAEG